jgi:hypothetical protein
MKKFVIVFAMLISMCTCYADVYTWKDSQGVVHFSDQPHDGAERVKVPEIQTFSQPSSSQPSDSKADPSSKVDKSKQTYDVVEIIQPENNATIRNNDGSVQVSLKVEPALAPGDLIQLQFDGSAVGEPQANLQFQLSGVFRGAHSVAAQVVNRQGDVLGSSEPVTFFMQRPRVGMGQQPPPNPSR